MKKIIALIVLLTVTISFGTAFAQKKDEKSLVGQNFIEVEAKSWLNSDALKVADQKGKIVILEFWATWCPPCRKSIPHLIELYDKYKDKGVTFMAFTDEAKETVEPFVKEMKMPYPIGIESKIGVSYNVSGIPHAVVIGTDGKIAWEGHPMEPEFVKKVEELAATVDLKALAPAAEVKKDEKAPATTEVKTEEKAAPAGK
ncbi:MAG TPA: TlpA disulfide reductase family protein [Candidatus Wallbacteria bacterium]|nr:TlpA disulfide reductase family protein [Candidatus Wallbacteria bacterium]